MFEPNLKNHIYTFGETNRVKNETCGQNTHKIEWTRARMTKLLSNQTARQKHQSEGENPSSKPSKEGCFMLVCLIHLSDEYMAFLTNERSTK